VQHRVTLKIFPSQTNIKAAERPMARVRREIDLDILDYKRHFPQSQVSLLVTFANFAEEWLGRLVYAKETIAGYKMAMRHIWIPAFGERHLAHIRPSEIRDIIC
jgi:hypothetical protein